MAREPRIDVMELRHPRRQTLRPASRPSRDAADDVHELEYLHVALAQPVVQVEIVGDVRVLQQVAAHAGQPGREGAQPGEVVAAGGVQRLEVLVEPAFHVGPEPCLPAAPALALHLRVAAAQHQAGDVFPRRRRGRDVRELAGAQMVDDVPRLAVQLGDGQGQQLQPRHVPGQGLLRAGGAEEVRRPRQQELALLMRTEPVGDLLDGRDQGRDVLELVQHRAPVPQRAEEPMRVALHRRQGRLVVQGDVFQAQVAGDRTRQRRLPRLPGTRQVDDAELGQQLSEEGLQASRVQGGDSVDARSPVGGRAPRSDGCPSRNILPVVARNARA